MPEKTNKMMVKNFFHRENVKTIITGKSMTKSEYASELDRNKIMEKYKNFGVMPHELADKGYYADVSEIGDYFESKTTVKDAERAFLTIPARIRKEFNNDPGKLMDFLNDPKNEDKARELGILNKKPDLGSSFSQEAPPTMGGVSTSPTGGAKDEPVGKPE